MESRRLNIFGRTMASIFKLPLTALFAVLGILLVVLILVLVLVGTVLVIVLSPIFVVEAAMYTDWRKQLREVRSSWAEPWEWGEAKIAKGWHRWTSFAVTAPH